jgi:RNA polymerase sigma-70 factor (ECF subfamily)
MDEQGFTIAVKEHRDMLYRIAYTMLRSNEDCADVLQESLVKAWQRLHTLRDDARFRGWVTRIVVNSCRDMLRKRKLRVYSELTEDIPAPQAPDPHVREALQLLSEGLRLPIVLHYMEGMSIREIAEVLRLPQGTVKNRMHRGRECLEQILREEDDWNEDFARTAAAGVSAYAAPGQRQNR